MEVTRPSVTSRIRLTEVRKEIAALSAKAAPRSKRLVADLREQEKDIKASISACDRAASERLNRSEHSGRRPPARKEKAAPPPSMAPKGGAKRSVEQPAADAKKVSFAKGPRSAAPAKTARKENLGVEDDDVEFLESTPPPEPATLAEGIHRSNAPQAFHDFQPTEQAHAGTLALVEASGAGNECQANAIAWALSGGKLPDTGLVEKIRRCSAVLAQRVLRRSKDSFEDPMAFLEATGLSREIIDEVARAGARDMHGLAHLIFAIEAAGFPLAVDIVAYGGARGKKLTPRVIHTVSNRLARGNDSVKPVTVSIALYRLHYDPFVEVDVSGIPLGAAKPSLLDGAWAPERIADAVEYFMSRFSDFDRKMTAITEFVYSEVARNRAAAAVNTEATPAAASGQANGAADANGPAAGANQPAPAAAATTAAAGAAAAAAGGTTEPAPPQLQQQQQQQQQRQQQPTETVETAPASPLGNANAAGRQNSPAASNDNPAANATAPAPGAATGAAESAHRLEAPAAAGTGALPGAQPSSMPPRPNKSRTPAASMQQGGRSASRSASPSTGSGNGNAI
jgi:hypothetical protein